MIQIKRIKIFFHADNSNNDGVLVKDNWCSSILLGEQFNTTDDLILLRKVYEELDDLIASDIMDYVEENQLGLNIDNKEYKWKDIEKIFEN